MPIQIPKGLLARKTSAEWDKLSPYEKVEYMLEVHTRGHDGKEVSCYINICTMYLVKSIPLHRFACFCFCRG